MMDAPEALAAVLSSAKVLTVTVRPPDPPVVPTIVSIDQFFETLFGNSNLR